MAHTNGKLLIVTDGKAGHENQSRAFCQALGYEADLAYASYPTRLHKALSYLIDRLGLVVDFPFKIEKAEDFYSAVVCTGSTAFYPGKIAARRRGIPVVAILYPSGYKKMNFDCILAPTYDRPLPYPNILPIPINLALQDEDAYQNATESFLKRHTPTKPSVSIILGGPNRIAGMKPCDIQPVLERIFELTPDHEHWVTTSRRTPSAIEALLAKFPFDFKLLYSQDPFNPIPAFVTLSERLFVTAESTAMLSEAVTHGNACVEALMNLRNTRTKFARFVRNLEEQQALHCFDGTLGTANHKINLTPILEQARAMLGL